jgi:indole-3-glycerol phosphate synthase
MTILEKIIAYKKPLLEEKKLQVGVKNLELSPFFNRQTISFKKALTEPKSSGIIAEFKRRSPSKSTINLSADIEKVTTGYQETGAAALSILTDTHFFGGQNKDIETIRNLIHKPILRKDFIFDTYQIYEAKSIGADAILLIAEVLTKEAVTQLSATAHQLGLEVLMELHSPEQLSKIGPDIDVIGVNNRDLKSFETSITHSQKIAHQLPEGLVKISESGLRSANDIKQLKQFGYQGFLIGEMFMKTNNPPAECSQLIKEISL